MSCGLTTAINDRTCAGTKGGIKSVIPIPVDNRASLVIVNNEVTTLTVTAPVYQYKLRQNLSNFTAPPRRNENDAVWYDQTLAIRFNSDNKEQRLEFDLLGRNELMFIVEKADGSFVLLGAGDGLRLGSDSTYGSGTVKSDGTPTVLNFLGQENDPIPDVDPAVVASLLAPPSPSV
jgi:hypothetical protein